MGQIVDFILLEMGQINDYILCRKINTTFLHLMHMAIDPLPT